MSKDRSEREERLLSGLGLCVKAGRVIFGAPMICEALKKSGAGKPTLVLEAADTSENTHKRITDKCTYYRVRHIRLGCGGEELSAALGKTSFLAAVAVTDEGMTRLLEPYL